MTQFPLNGENPGLTVSAGVYYEGPGQLNFIWNFTTGLSSDLRTEEYEEIQTSESFI